MSFLWRLLRWLLVPASAVATIAVVIVLAWWAVTLADRRCPVDSMIGGARVEPWHTHRGRDRHRRGSGVDRTGVGDATGHGRTPPRAYHRHARLRSAKAAPASVPGPFGPVPDRRVVTLGAVGAVPAGTGVVDGNEIPYKPEAVEQQRRNQENWLTSDPEIKCYLPGVPRATYMPVPFQIFQSDSAIFIAYEYAGAARNLQLRGSRRGAGRFLDGPVLRPWEDDTLVVEALARRLDRPLGGRHTDRRDHELQSRPELSSRDQAPALHDQDAVVTERFTRVSDTEIAYGFEVVDPGAYTQPWKGEMALRHTDALIYEYACHEGNYALPGILAGARVQERE